MTIILINKNININKTIVKDTWQNNRNLSKNKN